MDTQQPSSSSLNPDPAVIVGIVEKLVEGRWPRSDAERKALFQRLGFTSGAPWGNDAIPSSTEHFSLGTQQPGEISSAWTAQGGHFMGISMHLYSAMDTGNPSTLQGFEDFRQQLTARYGVAANPWHDPVVPACVWNVNGRRIVIRFFNLQHSSMLLSVEDAGLAAAAEAAARRNTARTHWNNSEEAVSPFVLPRLGRRAD